MRVVVFRGLEPVIVEGADLVLVESDAGTPISVTSQVHTIPAAFVTKHCDEPGFSQLLTGLGIDRTVIVSRARAPKLADLDMSPIRG